MASFDRDRLDGGASHCLSSTAIRPHAAALFIPGNRSKVLCYGIDLAVRKHHFSVISPVPTVQCFADMAPTCPHRPPGSHPAGRHSDASSKNSSSVSFLRLLAQP